MEEEMRCRELVFPCANTQTGKLGRTLDWSKTSLGPVKNWPSSLRTLVSICTTTLFPRLVLWGPDLIQIYNDPYSQMLGPRHPSAFGCSIKGPMFAHVISSQQVVLHKDFFFLMDDDSGHKIERYFTYGFSPLFLEDGTVGGVMNTTAETTGKIINERQLKTLHDIGLGSGQVTNLKEACISLANNLSKNQSDFPFLAIYLIESQQLNLIETVNILRDTDLTPSTFHTQTKITDAIHRVLTTGLNETFDLTGYSVPKSPAVDQEPCYPRYCKILALKPSQGHPMLGILLVGINPIRPIQESEQFLNLVSIQSGNILANAKLHQEEQLRAEQLQELDRSKTMFFTNISHEFRTPITLMIGPIQELLEKETPIRKDLELIYRNTLRLLKLVNSLLDYSKIDQGRLQARFQPIDISMLTTDLVSVFRSACERAQLELRVQCPRLSETVYLDVEMYEKIVMNLISNAYKATLKGHINVCIKQIGKHAVQLIVDDSGKGIPENELGKLFDRFYRVKNSCGGRTSEGTGIGLSMVQKLVKIHGGSIQVYSRVGVGSMFIVTLPLGHSHLNRENIVQSSSSSTPLYSRTAEWWIGTDAQTFETRAETGRKRLLVVDDNADMREYIYSLLSQDYEVHLVSDGVQALDFVCKQIPDLILSDIMMHNLDGIGLLKALREEPKTATIPVIFLSAAEESRIYGIQLGASDYLAKPFTAKELRARVRAQLELHSLRSEAQLKHESATRTKTHFLAVLSHELRTPLNSVLLLAESMAKDESLPINVRKDLEVIRKSIKIETSLIDDLLDVTRITNDKLVLQSKQVNLFDILQDTVSEFRESPITTSYHSSYFVVNGDASRLKQIFTNILNNAIKYGKGKTIVSTQELQDMVQVSIRDNGIGMEKEMESKVFSMFRQEPSAVGGLGLGLFIAKSLAEKMSGTISAHSDGIGMGTTFVVRFPVVKSPAIVVYQNVPDTNMEVPSQRILLIEDDKSSSMIMKRFLRKLGHEVKAAFSVKEALEVAGENKFDLVISDVGLPDGSGFDLMKRLSSTYGLRGICLSGFGLEEDIKQSRESGFDLHILKPVEMKLLQSSIFQIVTKM